MPRKQQTAADYIVMALSPMLIMTLVGSLVFFLLQVMYQGSYQERVQWMLFWFVLATVLIGRIGIEQGRAHAAIYAAAMGLACFAFAYKFLSEYLLGTSFLLVVIWWCSDKLTWDCTFIDDSEDASGEGLLQQAGIEQKQEEAPAGPVETEKQRRRRLRREKLYPELAAAQRTTEPVKSTSDATIKAENKKKKSHAPGVWVVYFSLLALPLFGLGQARLPMDRPEVRTYGFQLLWVYVASALGLLLTTSFLGLRRYLRQRNMQMPARITAAWLTSGAMIVLVIMLLCLVIPRPQADQSVTAWLDRFAEEHEASEHAMLGDDKAEGEGRRIGEKQNDPNAEQADAQGKGKPENKEGEGEKTAANGEKQGEQKGENSANDKSSNEEKTAQNQKSSQNQQNQNSSEKTSDNKQQNDDRQAENNQQNNKENNDDQRQAENNNDNQKQNDKQDQQKQEEEQQDKDRIAKNEEPKNEEKAENQSGSSSDAQQSPPPGSSWMSTLANGLKWLIYIVCGLLILWGLWKNRESIFQGAADFFRSIANFWSSLFNWGQTKKKSTAVAGDEQQFVEPPRKRFAEYPNPFLTGEAHRMRADALAIYTWEAFQAFGYEQGVRLEFEMTAMEFGREVEARFPELSKAVNFLTQACSRIHYSQKPPTDFDIKPLEALWRGMSQISSGVREPSYS